MSVKLLIILPLALFSQILWGQVGFAIISDKDGFCNVRSTAAKGNNIVDTLYNGHLVYCSGANGNWTNVMYRKKKENLLYGQVYSDRLTLVSGYTAFSKLSESTNQISFKKDSIKIVLIQQPFTKARYKLSYYKDNSQYIEKINGKQYWGTDGETPKQEYKSIEIYYGKRKIVLPKMALDNLFEPSLYHTEVHCDLVNDILYVESSNSDGAGAYGVVWKIEKGIYKERYIAYGF